MLILDKISESLARLKGTDTVDPTVVAWSDDKQFAVEVEFVAVDSLSCAFRELRFSAFTLRDASLDVLQSWSRNLCQRITYLLEHIGPLEVDLLSKTILIRSTPPDRNNGTVSFYEILIEPVGGLRLRRQSRSRGEVDSQQLNIQVTHEVLCKLVQDLINSVPTPAMRPGTAPAA